MRLFRRAKRERQSQPHRRIDIDPRSRVERGAALLDAQSPGWEKKIDPGTLDISSIDNCVLGQVYGSYGNGLRVLGGEKETVPIGFSINHGFACTEDAYEWVRLIDKRELARSV
jgi:hypothetical protein